jgi:hypothetical protein
VFNKYFTTVCIVLSVSGCAGMHQKQINDAIAQANLEAAKCTEGQLTRGNAIERRNCVDSSIVKNLSAANYAYMPLLLQFHASNKLLAIAFAEGKISKVEYEARLQKNEADFALIEAQAIAQNQRAQAEAWHRASMSFQNAQALQQQQNYQQQMLMRQNMPSNTNCNVFGNSMNCTTW